MIEKAVAEFPNFKATATTMRGVKTATINDWGAMCWVDGQFYESKQRSNLEIMDRVGGGDSFASGFIYGLMQFDTVFIMTEGGPANASEIIAIHMYRTAFEKLKLGAGASIGYVLTMICIILGLFYVNVLNKIEKKY